MSRTVFGDRGGWVGSALLLGAVVLTGGGLAAWKLSDLRAEEAASASMPEPAEVVTVATAEQRSYRQTTTSVGTVLAPQWVTLRNELAGTVRRVSLVPGQIVEPGRVLVALDVSVEEADLRAQEAEAALAETVVARLERLVEHRAVSQEELDRARAERDVAKAQIARIKAIIERKTIRAPFRARVGIADVHPGQYLNEGTVLTTLQGVDGAENVDFTVSQRVASGLRPDDTVTVVASDGTKLPARITAIDARVDPETRNAMVRARIIGPATLRPGASVRVLVPAAEAAKVVAIPVSALRKGPGGDHVFVVTQDSTGASRAAVRTVRSGPVVGDEVLIESGLEPGEEVAASGSFKLRDGVLIARADTSTPSAAGGK